MAVYIDDNLIGLISAGEEGRFSMTVPSPLGDGLHRVFVEATDEAGNSTTSETISFTVDTLPPVPPVIVYPRQLDVTTKTPAILGMAEPGSTVLVLVDGILEGSTPVDSAGNFTFTVFKSLIAGWHTVSAQARDSAGNTSTVSPGVEFFADQ